jgi:hypothetical protein
MKNFAEQQGLEPLMLVLETRVIPFNYRPILSQKYK